MDIISNLVSRLHLDRFFSSKLILAIDMFVSLAASVCTIVFVRYLLVLGGVTEMFSLVWVGLSLLFSFVYFYFLKTYRTIVRHTTLKEFAKI